MRETLLAAGRRDPVKLKRGRTVLVRISERDRGGPVPRVGGRPEGGPAGCGRN